jgi:hypothetical protein
MTTTEQGRGTSGSVPMKAAVTLIVIHSFMISASLVLIAGMLGAVAAFADRVTITIPLVATFRGFAEADNSLRSWR